MGWNYSFVAFRTPLEAALGKLRLQRTGTFTELAESDFSMVTLASGWVVVVANRDFRFIERPRLEDLSFDGELIGCAMAETSMNSQAQAWRHGVCEWAVIHDGSVGQRHFLIEGAPPREVHALLETARGKRQPGVDFVFNVPLELVSAVMDFELGAEQRFEALAPVELPWRVFRHPDGRVWSIRAGGPGYQLRIGAEHDDPVFKERASTRPLRDLEALIREQVADGFVQE